MGFCEWFDRFALFLKGYYCGLPLEKRCRTATEIVTDAIQAYRSACNETDWLEKEEAG